MRKALCPLFVSAALAGAVLFVNPTRALASGCDLFTTAASCTFNGGNFFSVDPHPTGTGYIDSFLRIQQKGTEQGYNTSGRPVQYDEKTDPNFTRNLRNSDVPVVNGYRQFFLDINEQSSTWGKNITLDQLEIYVSNTPSLTGVHSTAGGGSLAGAVKIYDMDTMSTDNWVNLDYTLNDGGSGTGDMVFYLPDSGFAGYQYVYLYSQFGCVPGSNGKCGSGSTLKYQSGAGFEEWWTLSPNSDVQQPLAGMPEPGTFMLMGTGILALARRYRKGRAA